MFDIAKYLEKFKIMSESRDFLRDSLAEAIQQICNIEIDPKKIVIKDGIARISEKPIVKNEIFIKKSKILESANKKIEKKIIDIL